MRAKEIHEERGQKTFALVFDTGDEVVSGLTGFAKANGLTAASLTAIGAFSDVTLGYFDMEKKDYEEIPVDEQIEFSRLWVTSPSTKGNRSCTRTWWSENPTGRPEVATSWRLACARRSKSSSSSLRNTYGARSTSRRVFR